MAAAKKATKPKLTEKDQQAIKNLLSVQYCGVLLETIAELTAKGQIGKPLRKVLELADARAADAAWRRRMANMLSGIM